MLDTANRTFICSVVFIDLVGYSKKPVTEQIRLKTSLTSNLSEAIKDIPVNDRIILDTGDGAAISFLGDPEDALFVTLSLREAMMREGMTATMVEASGDDSVRMGINLGPVQLVKDINGQPNIIGDGINVAQRIMSFARPGQLAGLALVLRRGVVPVARLRQALPLRGLAHRQARARARDLRGRPPRGRAAEGQGRHEGPRDGDLAQRAQAFLHEHRLLDSHAERPGIRPGQEEDDQADHQPGLIVAVLFIRADDQARDSATAGHHRGHRARRGADEGHQAVGPRQPPSRRHRCPTRQRPRRRSLRRPPKPAKAEPAKAPDSKVLSPAPSPSVIPPPAPAAATGPDAAKDVKKEGEKAARDKAASEAKGESKSTESKSGIPPATVFLDIKPWGEIYVNGRSQGVSPPKKFIKLDPGKYKIEFRNTTFPAHTESVDVKAREEITLRHRFQ